MESIIAKQPFQLSEGNLFEKVTRPEQEVKAHEIGIQVEASGVNPIDAKTRQTPVTGEVRVLGYEGAGVVDKVGSNVTRFKKGDKVMFVGAPKWEGSNQTYQVLGEHYVTHLPEHLSFEEGATLPLTAFTAYETLFDIFGISRDASQNLGRTILIINGAGGVGSIATQIAKAYGLNVITTASRQETIAWSQKMGADTVLNHREDLEAQFEAHNLPQPDYIFCTYDTDRYYEPMIRLVKPRGHIATIVVFKENQDLNALKQKAITFTHESMFTRLTYEFETEYYQKYLDDLAEKLNAGVYQSTLTEVLHGLTPENVYKGHQMMEEQSHIGKLAIKF
ncbi:zinc-binding alcohol dehydrogenase family protein [Staphylococcus canis]|uniref:Zinc-binding alcohol dehydrogenase family protein n=1 Tax=Staphylococcus canis TaxID=2724942 RepID=A0ABS0T7H3_9STAP|nr:zinc-binding alcohol dehydrogenase family protein [Staphylococcus canis]MBI5974699.1 zinc-binding alcohol dehydrogenase family protein [Staphylococcus canis]